MPRFRVFGKTIALVEWCCGWQFLLAFCLVLAHLKPVFGALGEAVSPSLNVSPAHACGQTFLEPAAGARSTSLRRYQAAAALQARPWTNRLLEDSMEETLEEAFNDVLYCRCTKKTLDDAILKFGVLILYHF